MPACPEFRVVYWGTVGSFPRAITNAALADRLVSAILCLVRSGCGSELTRLESVVVAGGGANAIERLLQQHVPVSIRESIGTSTTCIEIETPEATLLVDAGTGLLEWTRQAVSLLATDEQTCRKKLQGHLFLTHAHLDHVCGLPFADVLYRSDADYTLWAAPEVLDELQSVFQNARPPRANLFPMSLRDLKGIKSMRPIRAGESVSIGQTRVSTMSLRHPGGSLAYRFERGHRRIVIATDHEHAQDADARLAEFAHQANLLYLDAQYQACEYTGEKGIGGGAAFCREGWGHSTVEACVRTALAANVHMLHLGHHDPNRSQQELCDLERMAKRLAENERRSEHEVTEEPARQLQISLAREQAVWEYP